MLIYEYFYDNNIVCIEVNDVYSEKFSIVQMEMIIWLLSLMYAK